MPTSVIADTAADRSLSSRHDKPLWLERSRRAAALAFGPPESRPFSIRYWDTGVVESPPDGQAPTFTVVLNHPGALRRMLLLPTQLHLAEAYIYGDIDLRGSVEAATATAVTVRDRLSQPGALRHLIATLLGLPRDRHDHHAARRDQDAAHAGKLHSPERDARAIQSHYDVGNDFYQLFLDSRMVYSCAYWDDGVETLDQAQLAKIDHICRKLRLQPGETLLDIGCGWGGLILHAARHYGVIAHGITVSQAQADLVQSRIASASLGDRCRIELRDYRALPRDARYDKIVSVGMSEHVGPGKLPTYFRAIRRVLKPGGLLLNHSITKDRPEPQKLGRFFRWHGGDFTSHYVFPDGELEPLNEVVDAGMQTGLEVRDVESLREHYARTLREWNRRLEAAHAAAVNMVGEATYRIWRLHLGGSPAGFASGRLNLHQVLFALPRRDGAVDDLPSTRRDLYQ